MSDNNLPTQSDVAIKQPDEAVNNSKCGAKRNRRKRKAKKKPKEEKNCNSSLTFAIRPIIKPQFGFVIRRKQATQRNKKININQYIPSGCDFYSFESNQKKMPHATPLEPILQESDSKSISSDINGTKKKTALKKDSQQIPMISNQQKSKGVPQKMQPARQQRGAKIDLPGHSNWLESHLVPTPSIYKKTPLKDKPQKYQPVKYERPVKINFPPTCSRDEALAGIEDGSLFQGSIRINPNNFNDAFCASADRNDPDFYIGTVADRNTALEGDIVALRLLPQCLWGDKKKVSSVVHILERVHPRIAAGHLTVIQVALHLVPVFTPRDKRFPRMNIEANLPPNFLQHFKKYASTLFMAKLDKWLNPKYGHGTIIEKLGESGDLKLESRGILLENGIQFGPFPPEALECMPESYALTEEEIMLRLDLRDECVFTIDPLTARDLDDALHVKPLPNGNFEVGVHIADVAYYLHEDTLLDELVSKRATTTYLVDSVYHMLPKEMCMALSLLPGRDCAAFSVIWEMTPDGTVVGKNFARTVIRNCTQLAYEHAQWMIMNPDAQTWHIDMPEIHEYSAADIRKRVLILHGMAQQMRKRRYQNGALHISQVKMHFALNSSGEPIEFSEQQSKEANNLIEEFMLQANISVAEKIYHVYPDLALLRCHDEINPRMISNVRDRLEMIGIHLNVESSGEIHQSIQSFKALGSEEYAKYVAINHMLAKPMTRAAYFCANDRNYGGFHHFALSIPIYTHFTSPIRRYADVVVHRLLAAAVGLTDKPSWPVQKFTAVARICNEMKYSAKKAGEASCELMLHKYVECHQPFNAAAVVVQVFEKCFEVLVLVTGTVLRIFTDDIENVSVTVESVEGQGNIRMNKLIIQHEEEEGQPACMQTIDIFQVVHIALFPKSKSIKLRGTLLRPRFDSMTRVG